MTKITTRPATLPSTPGSSAAPRPAEAAPAATSPAAWSRGPSVSATERRERATGVSTATAALSDAQKAEVVQKKATCPFIGAGVATGALPVRNTADKPLASIDDVARLGNTGKGSNLGELLKVFAEGNHGFMPGMSGKLDLPVPKGTLSLDFPGSQGSHAGHSGILQGDPKATGSGRFSGSDFDGLMKYAKNGHVSRSDIGKFIAANVAKDPNAHAPGLKTAGLLIKDLGALAGQLATSSNPADDRKVYQKLTKLLGEDNLVGSSGEFGLMAAFLANSPKTIEVKSGLIGHEPAYSVEDLTAMFKDKQFPEGWETWKKTSHDWVTNTTALAVAAEKETIRLKLR